MASMAQAIRLGLHYGESFLGVREIFGQDVGPPLGGVFTCTQGLKTAWNTPLDERGIVGAAIGIALAGERAVAEIQFCDYIFNTIDLLKMAGNTLWASNGQYSLPLVLMTPVGAGIRGSLYHSHSFDSWAARIPGWKVVIPSNPLDAYGLLTSAIEDPNPVMFLIPKALMRVRGRELLPGEPVDEKELKARIDAPIGERSGWTPDWPEMGYYSVPIGRGKIAIEGEDLTLVSYGRMVDLCVEVSRSLGGAIEVIDLRSIYPYDWELIKKSVKKTKRVIFVNEDTEITNFGEHLACRVTSELFYYLFAPPRVVAGRNVPGVGLHPALEEATIPNKERIAEEIQTVLKERP